MESNEVDRLTQWSPNIRDKLLGMLFIFICALSFSTEDILLYVVIEEFHPCLIYVFNASVSFILCFLLTLILRPRCPATKEQFLLVILHGSLNTLGQLCIATAVFAIGPGTAVALFFTVPIFTTVYSVLFLRTKIQITNIFFATCSTVGVALLTRYLTITEDQGLNGSFPLAVGVACALAAAMSYSGGLVVGRKLSDYQTPSLVNILSYTSQYSIVAIILCFAFDAWEIPTTLSSLVLLIGTGVTTFCGMLFGYLAVCYEKPTTVSIILTSEVIMTFIGQFTLFSFPFHWTVSVGAILILFSSVGIILMESQNQEDNERENVNENENDPILMKSSTSK